MYIANLALPADWQMAEAPPPAFNLARRRISCRNFRQSMSVLRFPDVEFRNDAIPAHDAVAGLGCSGSVDNDEICSGGDRSGCTKRQHQLPVSDFAILAAGGIDGDGVGGGDLDWDVSG